MPERDVSVMWFRRDLRVRDHPALVAAAAHQGCVPLFVFDERLLTEGRFPSAMRTRFMLGCLSELDEALRERGGKLVVRSGRPEHVVPALCAEVGATDVYFTADASPWARARDQRVIDELDGVRAHAMPGACVVDDPSKIETKQGGPYTVFTPFARAWRQVPRRELLSAPQEIRTPQDVAAGELPSLREVGFDDVLPKETFAPGEEAARRQATRFLREGGLAAYADTRNAPKGGSSRLSPYLRWGCLSSLKLDVRVAEARGDGPDDYRDELAWRDFYAAVLMHFPFVTHHEFQEKYRSLEWSEPGEELEAWTEGQTGFPLVDAGMRQLAAEGWMHNRVRMVVGSFLTKDLHLDWREGERVFMERLIDGDMAANNGGWQWIASTGTDAKPYFQRLFNPITQQEKFDPEGEYVRRWCPELSGVPAKKLSKPWTMSDEEQGTAGCVIGEDYPGPIVDHQAERRRAVERYRAVSGG
ncbi:MAG: deoxyribodipyrimidine photo-lyase [Solirubrobacterales bacterium]|nr:deoxyribodipyrimidine photo-lyase [Solirubrobacterales bacterium]